MIQSMDKSQDPAIWSVASLGPLESRPSLALDTLLAHAEAMRTSVITTEQHLQLVYDGFQAIVDFLGLGIDVTSIPVSSDPAGRMNHAVNSVKSCIQSLVPRQCQPPVEQPPMDTMKLANNRSARSLRACSDVASLAGKCQCKVCAIGTPGVYNPGQLTSDLGEAESFEAPSVSKDDCIPAQTLVAPDPCSMAQSGSDGVDHRLDLPPCSPCDRHQRATTPHANLTNTDEAREVLSPMRSPPKTNTHSSPPTLTCNFPDLLATPPSQRQQRQTFPETEVFVPFFGAQLPPESIMLPEALPDGPAQCAKKPATRAPAVEFARKDAAVAPESGAPDLVTDRSDQPSGCTHLAPAEATPGCHPNTTGPPGTARVASPSTLSVALIAEPLPDAAKLSAPSDKPSPTTSGWTAAAASTVSRTPEASVPPQRSLTRAGLPPHNLVARHPPAPCLSFAAAPCRASRPVQAAAGPAAGGGSFGWRPLAAGTSAAKRPPAPASHAYTPGTSAAPSLAAHPGGAATHERQRRSDAIASVLPGSEASPGHDTGTGHMRERGGQQATLPEAPGASDLDLFGRAGGEEHAEGERAAGDGGADGVLQDGTPEERPCTDRARKAHVRKGEWRKRACKARAGGAETQAPRCGDDVQLSVLSSHGTGSDGHRGDPPPSAAATATFRGHSAMQATAGGSPQAAPVCGRPSISAGAARQSPPVRVAEVLARSPARCAAARRGIECAIPQPTGLSGAMEASLAADEALRLRVAPAGCTPDGHAGSIAGVEHCGPSLGIAAVAGASGCVHASSAELAPEPRGRSRNRGTVAEPVGEGTEATKQSADVKAVRKGKWQSRKNTNAIFESRDKKRTGRIDAMLRSAGSASGKAAMKSAPVLALEKADVKGGYDGTLQQRRAAAVASAAAGGVGAGDEGARVYDQRVRKRADREALQAWECQACMEFYELLARQGYEYNADVFEGCAECGAGAPKRTKVNGGGVGHANGVAQPDGGPSTPDGKEAGAGALLQAVGRHRHKFVAPPTQENFWAIGFEDDWQAPKRPWRKNGVNKNRMVS